MITNSKIGKYGSYHERIMQYVRGIDWSLFLFLVLVLNVKLIVKAIAILFLRSSTGNMCLKNVPGHNDFYGSMQA